MIRTQISFERDLYQQAQREAARLGISLAELCRRSLRRGLGMKGTRQNSPWLRYTGSISGGRVDESSKANIDSVVYGEKAQR